MTLPGLSTTLVVLFLCLFELVNSLPTPNTTTPLSLHLSKRQCVKNPATDAYAPEFCDPLLPTLDEIVARIRDTSDGGQATPAHSAVFYSNLAGTARPSMEEIRLAGQWVLAWLTQRRSTGKQFYWVVRRRVQEAHVKTSVTAYKETWGPGALTTFDYCSYQALAAAALHPTAYVFLPRGATPQTPTWKPESVWEHTEFWQLTKNPHVQKIVRVDPRPWNVIGITPLQWCSWSDEQVLWERGVDEELEPRWQCPVEYDANGNPQ